MIVLHRSLSNRVSSRRSGLVLTIRLGVSSAQAPGEPHAAPAARTKIEPRGSTSRTSGAPTSGGRLPYATEGSRLHRRRRTTRRHARRCTERGRWPAACRSHRRTPRRAERCAGRRRRDRAHRPAVRRARAARRADRKARRRLRVPRRAGLGRIRVAAPLFRFARQRDLRVDASRRRETARETVLRRATARGCAASGRTASRSTRLGA